MTRLAARRPADLGPYVVDGALLGHPDGARSAVIATGELDLNALEPARAAQVVESFGRFCSALDSPLQLLVRVREVSAHVAASARNEHSTPREAAMRHHWQRRLAEQPAFARTVHVVVRARQEGALRERVERICDALRATGLAPRLLQDAELAGFVGDGLRVDLAVPWKEYPDHLEIGNDVIRGYVLRRFPGHAISPGWLAPLIHVQAGCDIAVHMAPAALGDALSSLARRLRDFSAHRMLEAERGQVGDAHVEAAICSALSLRDRLARNLARPLHVTLTACVRSREPGDLRRRCDLVRVAFAAALARVEPAHFRHLAAYLTTLPACTDLIGGAKLVESRAAATFFPWVDASAADPTGYRLGATRRGNLVRLDPFDAQRHTNANIAVLAASGHGKSYAIGLLVMEAADHGVSTVIIDPEGEYRSLVEALDGVCLELSPGTGAAVNVFDAAARDTEAAVTSVVELASVLCGGLTEIERAEVDRAARGACARSQRERRTPLLEDCVAPLQQHAPRVATVLGRHCTGALGALFNRETTVRIGPGASVISLRDLPEEHVPAVTLIVARWLWDLVRRRDTRRHIVFDEVGALSAHAPLRALLVQLARRCRKHDASLVVATQNAQDLLATEEGRVVATNCATVLLGGHGAAETALMEPAFGLTVGQRRFLETAARGEFLLLARDRRLEMRVEAPHLHRLVLEGSARARGDEKNPLTSSQGRPQDMGAPGRADPKMWENQGASEGRPG